MNSNSKNNRTEKFKKLLDQEYTWPSVYTFKFIVPREQENEVKKLFPNENILTKSSNKGKYISLTIDLKIDSSDLIIAIYEKAALIKGVISL